MCAPYRAESKKDKSKEGLTLVFVLITKSQSSNYCAELEAGNGDHAPSRLPPCRPSCSRAALELLRAWEGPLPLAPWYVVAAPGGPEVPSANRHGSISRIATVSAQTRGLTKRISPKQKQCSTNLVAVLGIALTRDGAWCFKMDH